ncbi:L,D-transpeptidase [Alsobacter sp. SYSU M60028]|uniref:L,D-transpeptidase n=1 Tax=Alsobacter ponti TaxID=2962936 RepID=A0ABT1LC44_9HYPH|nr:L,D-transpeptidase [Alsobacter ponti]MCP8939072.1 L,D-transpeptidase [Alsobacter ponti]
MTNALDSIRGLARLLPRTALALAAAGVLAACRYEPVAEPSLNARDTEYLALVPTIEMHLPFERYRVDDPTGEKPGTIVVDTKAKFLYLVEPGGKALRYGVATGDEAYGWTGVATVARKAEWPNWTPPAEMVKRWPHVHPTKGGPDNPLGARALYLYDHGHDTLYRIHGTNEPETIGRAASSGCIRMRNIDVIDLYNRVPVGATVIVR